MGLGNFGLLSLRNSICLEAEVVTDNFNLNLPRTSNQDKSLQTMHKCDNDNAMICFILFLSKMFRVSLGKEARQKIYTKFKP